MAQKLPKKIPFGRIMPFLASTADVDKILSPAITPIPGGIRVRIIESVTYGYADIVNGVIVKTVGEIQAAPGCVVTGLDVPKRLEQYKKRRVNHIPMAKKAFPFALPEEPVSKE